MPHVVKHRVIYADTDAMGVVYHTNYIRWFEIGRTELMRELGWVYADLERRGYYLPVTKVFCHYFLPARYDEIVRIETRIDYLKRVSVKFDYEIWDEQRERNLSEGYTVHAFVNGEGKITRPPPDLAESIRRATGR
ncbi:MAG: thioesterase family protein [Syntrophales bacterium]|nr:thioesterase family protein [Syntrophales bacterium]MDD5232495.1 thioesterase family protein [Syntrophales bacterium]